MENKKKKSTNSFEKAIMLEVMGKYFLLIATILVSVMFAIASPSFLKVVAFRAKCKIFSRHLQKPILKTEKGRFKGL